MNKTHKTQAFILLAIGLLLSPAVFALLSTFVGRTDDVAGIASFVIYIIFPLPAFISVMCIAFGVGRLVTASKKPMVPPVQPTSALLQKERQQKKNNLTALTVGTILLGIIAVVMLLFVIHLSQQENGLFLLIFPGAVPIAIVLFAVIMLPINIKNILKQKNSPSN